MSTWHEPKFEHMDVTEDGKEIHIHFTDDYSGAVYVVLKVEDVKKLLKA